MQLTWPVKQTKKTYPIVKFIFQPLEIFRGFFAAAAWGEKMWKKVAMKPSHLPSPCNVEFHLVVLPFSLHVSVGAPTSNKQVNECAVFDYSRRFVCSKDRCKLSRFLVCYMLM